MLSLFKNILFLGWAGRRELGRFLRLIKQNCLLSQYLVSAKMRAVFFKRLRGEANLLGQIYLALKLIAVTALAFKVFFNVLFSYVYKGNCGQF